MPESAGQAVFLSYASQDAEAARRICESLRAAGVEVWLDQEGGLAGGDAWDRKIKKQIKDCALFLPLISANTNARLEGYFRREWKLAVDRTHDMADEKAFLVPAVIDATTDTAASVPEKFREVQWTRLPDGAMTAQFCDRIRVLLAGGKISGGGNPGPNSAQPVPTRGAPASPPRRRLAWTIAALAAAGGLVLWGSWRGAKSSAPLPAVSAVSAGKATSPAIPALGEKSLAVLPFENQSADQGNSYFASGVQDDLLADLASLGALKIVSLVRQKDRAGNRAAARELGVAYLLEGGVRRDGHQLRVSAQVIHVATGEQRWAKVYPRELKELFAVQSELAREIAGALHAVLSPAEAAAIATRSTRNVDAYDSFQEARLIARSNPRVSDIREKIIPLLERAVAHDPDYADAWAELCRRRLELYRLSEPTAAQLASAGEAFARAERLARDSYAVLTAGIFYASVMRDRPKVEERRRRIIELFAGRPEAQRLLAGNAQAQGRWAEAQACYQTALRIDPRDPDVLGEYYRMLDGLRWWDEAGIVAAKLAEVQPGDFNIRLQAASMEFRRRGTTTQLTRLLTELPENSQRTDNANSVRLRIALLTANWTDLIALWRENGLNLRTANQRPHVVRLHAALAYLKVGDRDAAQPLLDESRAELTALLHADPRNLPHLNDLAAVHGMSGDRASLRAVVDRLGQLLAEGPQQLAVRFGYAEARSWLDDKHVVIEELGRLLREPTLQPVNKNVHLLRVTWGTMPLHGDQEFEAMLNDRRNNAPVPGS